jgi:hypothetical protein
MPLPNQQLPYLRYLKSQLLNLKRPSFWGTAIFLCLVGVLIREYWANPTNIFALNREQDKPIVTQQPANAGLTDEERALFADIDNLPVLLNEYEQSTLAILPNTSSDNNQNQKSENLLEAAIKKQNAANEAKSKANLPKNSIPANTKNPFVLQAENLLQPEISAGNGQFLGYKSFNNSLNNSLNQTRNDFNISPFESRLANQNRQIQNAGFVSPLENGLNQASNQNFPNLARNSINSAINPYQINNQNFPGFTNSNITSNSPFANNFGSRQTLMPNQSLSNNTGMGYIDPSITKPLQNPSESLNNNQTLPVQTTPVTGIAPINNTVPNNNYLNNNYSVPNQGQIPVNSSNSAGYNNYSNSGLPQSNYGNYGNSGGYGVQQPNQIPPSTYGNPGLQQPSQVPPNSAYPGQPEQYQNYPR